MLSRLGSTSFPNGKQRNSGLRGSYSMARILHNITDPRYSHALVYRRPCLRNRGGRQQITLTGPSSTALSAIKMAEGSRHGDLDAVFKKLQNGSDIRGFALDDNPDEPMNLTPGRMYYVGRAFGTWLRDRTGRRDALRVSIGSDPRLSSDVLSVSMAAGLAHEGIKVIQFGLCTTPAMFMSCILPKHKCDGAIMITASHLPKNRNGAKFFTPDGGLGKPDIKQILQTASETAAMDGLLDANAAWYVDHAIVAQAALECDAQLISKDEFLEDYAAYLRGIVIDQINHPDHRESPLRGLSIVVNPGNGSGGFFATKILGPLGANVSGSINLEPDGTFPAHKPNPEDAAAVDATKQAVLETRADLGIMLDTDVDRSGFIDRNGRPINRNKYIALAAAIALKTHPGATIVTDSCTSNGLKTFIESLGGRHFRFKKGYKNIIDKGIQLNEEGIDCPLMMETSGHGLSGWENYFLDDGAYGALKIVIEAVRRRIEGEPDISVLLEDLQEAKEAMEIRVKILADDVQSEGIKITEAFKEWLDAGAGGNDSWSLEPENYEGWRVNIAEKGGTYGWLLLRPSLHDPDIVINVESEQVGGMATHLQHLMSFFNQHSFSVSTDLVTTYMTDNSSSSKNHYFDK